MYQASSQHFKFNVKQRLGRGLGARLAGDCPGKSKELFVIYNNKIAALESCGSTLILCFQEELKQFESCGSSSLRDSKSKHSTKLPRCILHKTFYNVQSSHTDIAESHVLKTIWQYQYMYMTAIRNIILCTALFYTHVSTHYASQSKSRLISSISFLSIRSALSICIMLDELIFIIIIWLGIQLT